MPPRHRRDRGARLQCLTHNTPFERLRGVALIRDRALEVPETMPLRLIHFDSKGEERRSLQIEADALGLRIPR